MTTTEPPPNLPPRTDDLGRVLQRAFFRVLLFVLLAFAVLLAARFAYEMLLAHPELRTHCLIALLVAGVGSTLCLSGVLYSLDIPLLDRCPPWPIRWTLKLTKRFFALAQIPATLMALYPAALLIFNLKIPGQ